MLRCWLRTCRGHIAVAKEAMGDTVCLVGNIDPIDVLMRGTPDQVRQEAQRIIEIGKQCRGYMFNSGEMVPRMTPEENMIAMMEAAREFGTY